MEIERDDYNLVTCWITIWFQIFLVYKKLQNMIKQDQTAASCYPPHMKFPKVSGVNWIINLS